MKIKLVSIIGIITILFLFTACAGIQVINNLKSQALASTSKQNLKIAKAGDVNSKPSSSGNPKSEKVTAAVTKPAAIDEKPEQTVFKSGDKGDDVKKVQHRINKFGYKITEDGDYGEETVYAVMDFQFKHNIEIDGVIQGNTLNKLYETPNPAEMYKAQAAAVTNANAVTNQTSYEAMVNSADCPSYTNYLVMVILAEQKVYIFNGTQHQWKLINTFQCASGRADTPTIRGNFYIGDKGPEFNPGNGIQCKYFSQISGNYLFHSILYDENGGVVDPTLGEKASHGCVRLALENAKYIYDNVPIGSGIWIQ